MTRVTDRIRRRRKERIATGTTPPAPTEAYKV
jgi:hypothetical protein